MSSVEEKPETKVEGLVKDEETKVDENITEEGNDVKEEDQPEVESPVEQNNEEEEANDSEVKSEEENTEPKEQETTTQVEEVAEEENTNLDEESTENLESTESNEQDLFIVDLLKSDFVSSVVEKMKLTEKVQSYLDAKDYEAAGSEELWTSLYENTEWSTEAPSDTEGLSGFLLYKHHFESEFLDSENVDVDQEPEPVMMEEEEDIEKELLDLLRDPDKITTERVQKLLETEEFVISLQNGEDTVLTFLETPSTIIAMMNLLFNGPHIPSDMQNQRIIHITIQTLVSGIITDVFIMNPDLLDPLFDHLDDLNSESEGSQAKSGCLAKITSILFEKFTTQMIGYFQARETFIPSLLFNIHDPNLMELLYKFVDCDLTHNWLSESDLITRLVSLLHQEETLETQEHAAGVLSSLLSLCQSWPQSILINDILNNEVITGSIISFMESKPLNGESIKLGLRVLIGVLALISDELEDPPVVVTLLSNSIGFFKTVLANPGDVDNNEQLITTTGSLKRGFGFVRLGVLELLVSLLYTGFPVVVEFMLEEKIFTVILDLLFEFPWNNIIHNQISQLFSGLFCCNNPEIIQAVMEDSRLPQRIVEAHKASEENPVGYLGHLRELSNELVRVSKMSPAVGAFMNDIESWQSFVNEDLKEFNLVECVVQDDYLDYENQYFEEDYDEYVEVDDYDDESGSPVFEEYDEDNSQESF